MENGRNQHGLVQNAGDFLRERARPFGIKVAVPIAQTAINETIFSHSTYLSTREKVVYGGLSAALGVAGVVVAFVDEIGTYRKNHRA